MPNLDKIEDRSPLPIKRFPGGLEAQASKALLHGPLYLAPMATRWLNASGCATIWSACGGYGGLQPRWRHGAFAWRNGMIDGAPRLRSARFDVARFGALDNTGLYSCEGVANYKTVFRGLPNDGTARRTRLRTTR